MHTCRYNVVFFVIQRERRRRVAFRLKFATSLQKKEGEKSMREGGEADGGGDKRVYMSSQLGVQSTRPRSFDERTLALT
jgi:hypothetical protein